MPLDSGPCSVRLGPLAGRLLPWPPLGFKNFGSSYQRELGLKRPGPGTGREGSSELLGRSSWRPRGFPVPGTSVISERWLALEDAPGCRCLGDTSPARPSCSLSRSNDTVPMPSENSGSATTESISDLSVYCGEWDFCCCCSQIETAELYLKCFSFVLF